ncbi:ribonuclease P protein subunit p21 isoform X1 [Platichthys flesus]|uniref:ribonuclease P protein subunit p21 isoform X1 n=1 Tax=Platichthys flesus TaxID=8260 RepID=UPI001A8792E6|nr:ribonuclease P protein subunit p21 isoform X1 [Platichthys flesus]
MAHQLKDREAYQRLNYLHQAAHCVLSQNPENVELARFYSFTQRTIARRLVLRQDPSVKRTICKKCFSLLIPGVTATTRQQRKKRKTRFTVVTCLSCGQSKKFLNNPDYCLWVDNPKAQMDQQKPPGDELQMNTTYITSLSLCKLASQSFEIRMKPQTPTFELPLMELILFPMCCTWYGMFSFYSLFVHRFRPFCSTSDKKRQKS